MFRNVFLECKTLQHTKLHLVIIRFTVDMKSYMHISDYYDFSLHLLKTAAAESYLRLFNSESSLQTLTRLYIKNNFTLSSIQYGNIESPLQNALRHALHLSSEHSPCSENQIKPTSLLLIHSSFILCIQNKSQWSRIQICKS